MNRPPSNRRPRRGTNRDYYSSNQREVDSYGPRNSRLPASSSEQKINFNTGTIAVLAGVLILGVGVLGVLLPVQQMGVREI